MLSYTLLSDGSSDRVLGRIIDWVIESLMSGCGRSEEIVGRWADFRIWPKPPRLLPERIERTIEYFPCDLLFIHRDAEGVPIDERSREIQRALDGRQLRGSRPVQIIPVRMTEAWLLIDEAAIRRAAGNPRSHVELSLPNINAIEGKADPKQILHEALRRAAGDTRRRFRVNSAVHSVAESISDFSPLRGLPAFQAFEAETRDAFQAWLASRGAR